MHQICRKKIYSKISTQRPKLNPNQWSQEQKYQKRLPLPRYDRIECKRLNVKQIKIVEIPTPQGIRPLAVSNKICRISNSSIEFARILRGRTEIFIKAHHLNVYIRMTAKLISLLVRVKQVVTPNSHTVTPKGTGTTMWHIPRVSKPFLFPHSVVAMKNVFETLFEKQVSVQKEEQ